MADPTQCGKHNNGPSPMGETRHPGTWSTDTMSFQAGDDWPVEDGDPLVVKPGWRYFFLTLIGKSSSFI